MNAVPANSITARDRMVTTLCFALLLHGLVIFGVAFTADEPGESSGEPTLEIVMVNAPTDEPPEEADYIADASQRGAGNVEEQVRPRSPDSSQGRPDGSRERPDHDTRAEDAVADDVPDEHRPRTDTLTDPLLATEAPSHVSHVVALRSGAGSQRATRLGSALQLPSIPADTEAHTALAHSRNTRERFISVNTQETVYASYLQQWRTRIERVGNLNYPDEARRDGLTGVLALEVVIDHEGRVRHLLVRESSGHRVLDDAAMRIVYLASPFDPFPETLRAETDALRFVWEWEFGDGSHASSVRAMR